MFPAHPFVEEHFTQLFLSYPRFGVLTPDHIALVPLTLGIFLCLHPTATALWNALAAPSSHPGWLVLRTHGDDSF